MNKSLWMISFVAFLPFSLVEAKPLNLDQVADNANWLMHIDFDSARASSIGSFIMDEIESKSEAVERMAEVHMIRDTLPHFLYLATCPVA